MCFCNINELTFVVGLAWVDLYSVVRSTDEVYLHKVLPVGVLA